MKANQTPSQPAASTDVHAAEPAATSMFRPLSDGRVPSPQRDLETVMDIPVTLSVELGHAHMTIKQLLDTAQGSLIHLDSVPGEPLDLLVNGRLIAQGEVVVAEGKFGVRVTEIVTPTERMHRLNR